MKERKHTKENLRNVSRLRWTKWKANKDSKEVESKACAHCIGKEWWKRNCELFCVGMHSFFSLKWIKHYLSMQNFNDILIHRFSFQLTEHMCNECFKAQFTSKQLSNSIQMVNGIWQMKMIQLKNNDENTYRTNRKGSTSAEQKKSNMQQI